MKRRFWIGAAIGVTSLAVVAFAQDMDGVSVEAINRRAAELKQQAAELVGTAEKRQQEAQPEVQPVVDQAQNRIGQANVSGIDGVKQEDLDALVGSANRKLGGGSQPGVMVFVSLSMPKPALKRLIQDMSRAGGFVFFRGFPNNSLKQFKEQLAQVLGDEQNVRNIAINPRAFEAFQVVNAPTFVSVDTPFELCTQLQCESKVPDFDVMTGNVPVSYVLQTFANGGGPGARSARTALAQMEAQ
ncbi:MAG: type-F conjugative transfer system pilin assembly protein TrbC [Betaproteobacteria bacterium]|nr:type-F conjugative transfer system pilin assembly protein TrbC [Betaproteobacteria bacterium]